MNRKSGCLVGKVLKVDLSLRGTSERMLSREGSVGKQILACANLLSFGSAIEDRRELGGEEHEASRNRETASINRAILHFQYD